MKKKISLNKESDNFAIIYFQMLKLPQSFYAFVLHFICTLFFISLLEFER